MVKRHEILRTAFYSLPGMDIPMQVISDATLWSYAEISLEQLAAPDQDATVDELFASLKEGSYDLQHGPLLQTWLLHLDVDQQILFLCLPALCADSYSLMLFVDELRCAYTRQVPAEEALQYADVAAWQEEQLLEDEAALQREHWRKTELSRVTSVRLPFQQVLQTVEKQVNATFAPYATEIPIPDDLAQMLDAQARHYGVSISAWLLACWQVFLWRLCDEETFLIGVACDGRNYEELTNAMGPYTRFVPVRALFEKDRSFALVLASVNVHLQEATKRQMYFTWHDVYEQGKGSAIDPFFPITFEYTSWPTRFEAGDLTFSLLKSWSCTEPFVLKLRALQAGAQVQLALQYDPQRIPAEQAQSLTTLFRTLLLNVTAQPQAQIGSVSLLTADAQAHLLALFRAPARDWSEQGLHALFEEQVRLHPQHLAVISAHEQLTYEQLNARANQLAWVLRARGVGPTEPVGLCLPRQAQMLVGLLGILKAGSAYVPLDAGSPVARLTYQLQQSQARLLLTQKSVRPELPDWGGEIVCLDDLASQLAAASTQNLPSSSAGQDLAYIIYTSGSTGRPKGVMVQQRSVVNYTRAMCERLGSVPGWHYATVSTLAADLGNTAIFCALASGGCVQVLDYATVTSAEALARWGQQHPIDVLKMVPSHLSALLEGEQAAALLPRQALVLGGEVLPVGLLERIKQVGGSCAVYNHYGPTETTIGVLVNALGVLGSEHGSQQGERIALGRPLSNTQVYVLDRRLQVVPAGVTGELYIGGAGLAIGYRGQPEQTAERFVPHPYSEQEGERLYRTGDLARYREDGRIEFAGRSDGQVKIRGYRIEVGEIEAVLRQHPQVRESVVVVRQDASGESRMVGYVVSKQHVRLASEQLEAYLRQHVPEYMLPAGWVQLDALPLTANGKVDRARLPEPEQHVGEVEREQVGPRSPLEALVAQVWQDLLGVPMVGVHDSFFALGGHSLLATRVMARLQSMLQVTLPVSLLFAAPTVAALAQHLEQELGQRAGQVLPPLVAGKRPEAIPLSFAQQRLWFLDQLEPESTAYLTRHALRFSGHLVEAALERSLHTLVQRHESLRTTFEERAGQSVQVIHPAQRVRLPVIDLQHLDADQRERIARELAREEAQQPCHLEQGPLFRCALLRLDVHEQVLLLTLHHIITDEWSNAVLVSELTTLYQAYVHEQPSPLALLPIQYADYALWQRQWLRDDVLDAQLSYWRAQLANVSPLALPTDYPRPAVQTYRGATESRMVPVAVMEQVQALSQREGVTLFMTLLAAFQVLLLRYTGQSDISVGSPIANRTRAEIEGVVGFFVNTLVLRSDLSENPTFQQLLAKVRAVCLGAYAHQDIPFEKVVEAHQPERDLSRSPLFQVSFQLGQSYVPSHLAPGLSIRPVVDNEVQAHFDLNMMITETEQGLQCVAIYNIDLFKAQTIRRFLMNFQTLLEGVVAVPEMPVDMLPLLSEWERDQLLVRWNQTSGNISYDLCLHQLFEEQVERTPDRIAVVFEDEQVSYQELDQRANQLARYLQRRGVGPEVRVGLCLDRSVSLLVGLLGILKADGAYVPLDPSYPQERLAFVLQDAEIPLLLTQERLLERLPGMDREIVCLDGVAKKVIADESRSAPEHRGHAEQLAYVLYTSGSTGQPKGVMVPHRGLVNYLHWAAQTYVAPESNGIGAPLHSSIGFDLTVTSLFVPLLTGQSLLLLSEEPGISALAAALSDKNGFTLAKVTPSHLEALRQVVSAEQLADATQVLIIGGEALRHESLAFWQRSAPRTRLINEYGPTETVVGCSIYEVPRESTSTGAVPIGKPIANMQLYVLDKHGQLVPVGVTGELYVGGEGVTRGYLNRPELTAERFVPHPFSSEPGARLYRTGDLARYQSNGDLEYVGRVDHQVKLRGFRIELGEIEAVLDKHPDIRESVVVFQDENVSEKRLVAYVVASHETTPSVQEVRRYVRARLPEYMVPSHVIMLETLPLTSNGKVDRKALPVPVVSANHEFGEQEHARTPVEELLLDLWSKVLGSTHVGINENFFELGGHSLLVTQLIARMRAMLGVEVPVRAMFEAPTVAGIAQRVEQMVRKGEGIEVPPLVTVAHSNEVPLSFAQQRLWFLDQLHPGSTTYLGSEILHFSGALNARALERSLQEIIRRHEILRTTFAMRADQPVQVIHPTSSFILPVIDLQDLKQEQREEEMQSLARQEAQQPCDLTRGPLLRTYLLRLEPHKHVQLLTLHHIITDGWSSGVLAYELVSLYRSCVAEQPSQLPSLPVQYADYAIWQRQWLQSEILQRHITYWQQQLKGVSPLELPADASRNAIRSDRGARYSFTLPATLAVELASMSRQEGVTLFMTLLTAFQILLYRLSGQPDIVVGTDVANRTHVETESLIGFFVNLLALRTDLRGAPSFRKVVQQVRTMVLGAYAHQALPFELVVENVQVERKDHQTPLVQVLCVMRNIPMNIAELPGIELEIIDREDAAARFDLALFLQEEAGGIKGSVVYRAELFAEQTIAAWMHQFEVLLSNIVARPDTAVDVLEIYTDEEKAQQAKEKLERSHEKAKRLRAAKSKDFEIS
ncbi:non-ribosomal peptide synthetase [Ktedonobacteria bacterium brp13]|nr:non-ribosomal peptide synthetase [Ktedonobacteria bacterium brp13]